MGQSKFPVIVLGVLFLVSAGLAYLFYDKSQKLFDEKQTLQKEKDQLTEDNAALKGQVNSLRSEKDRLTRNLEEVNAMLARTEKERDDLKRRYDTTSQERDAALQEIQKLKASSPAGAQEMAAAVNQDAGATPATSDKYWQDLIVKRAELQTKLEKTVADLNAQTNQLKIVEQEKRDLADKVSALENDKRDLQSKIDFNTRTVEIISRDLIREKTSRNEAEERIKALKKENIEMRKELKMVAQIKEDTEKKYQQAQQVRNVLERKVKDVEGVLKEKALEMKELHEQVATTADTAQGVVAGQVKAVELPPIVVKPDTTPFSQPKVTQGRVLVVNEEEMLVGIDIGLSHGVRPGMKFVVLRQNQKIATLTVVKCQANVSVCDIEQIKPGERIIEKDLIELQ